MPTEDVKVSQIGALNKGRKPGMEGPLHDGDPPEVSSGQMNFSKCMIH